MKALGIGKSCFEKKMENAQFYFVSKFSESFKPEVGLYELGILENFENFQIFH